MEYGIRNIGCAIWYMVDLGEWVWAWVPGEVWLSAKLALSNAADMGRVEWCGKIYCSVKTPLRVV